MLCSYTCEACEQSQGRYFIKIVQLRSLIEWRIMNLAGQYNRDSQHQFSTRILAFVGHVIKFESRHNKEPPIGRTQYFRTLSGKYFNISVLKTTHLIDLGFVPH